MNKDINNSLLKICLICQHNISLKNRNYVNLSCECKNYYHSECLEKWYTYNKKCPICFKKNVKIIFLGNGESFKNKIINTLLTHIAIFNKKILIKNNNINNINNIKNNSIINKFLSSESIKYSLYLTLENYLNYNLSKSIGINKKIENEIINFLKILQFINNFTIY